VHHLRRRRAGQATRREAGEGFQGGGGSGGARHDGPRAPGRRGRASLRGRRWAWPQVCPLPSLPSHATSRPEPIFVIDAPSGGVHPLPLCRLGAAPRVPSAQSGLPAMRPPPSEPLCTTGTMGCSVTFPTHTSGPEHRVTFRPHTGRCDHCGVSIAGRTPFTRLQFTYCTTLCVREHMQVRRP
jgi:hypothetical protein